jgi:AcrR family transcriptional regulator
MGQGGGRGTSTSGTRVRLDREERQRQLAEACAYLIATQGYSNTSLRDVATRVGISTGTLLHHFQSKEDLLVATLLAVSDDFLEHMQAAAASTSDPVERLRAIVRSLLESPRHDVGWRVWIAFWHEAAANSELAPVASGRTDLAETLLADTIEAGRASGRLGSADPATSAAELAALVDGVAIRLYGEHGGWSHERAIGVIDRLIDDWVRAA